MTGYDLMQQLQSKVTLLDEAVRMVKQRGQGYAKAEKEYRIALSQKILIERNNGTPVTIMSDVCRGDKKIADLKFRRDVAEVMHRSALEAINAYKLEIKMLDAQIGREWGARGA